MNKPSFISACLAAFMLLSASCFAQRKSQSFICDSLTPFSIPELIVAAYQLGDCLEEVEDIDSARQLVEIMDLDVVDFYGLNKLYDSESARNQYKQTADYKSKLAELTAVRTEKQKHIYYSVLTNSLGGYSWAIKGFKFSMDDLSTPGGLKEAPPPPQTIYYSIELSSIPFAMDGATEQSISIPVHPDSGMSVVRNKTDVTTIVTYKLGKVVPKEYQYYNAQCHCNRNAKEEVIKTNFDRVIIFNPKTSELFWDVLYDKTGGK